jgi:hypothetical protein
MFAVLHSDINSPKSGLLHLTGQPYFKKCRSDKVKDGIKNLFLRNYLVGRCICELGDAYLGGFNVRQSTSGLFYYPPCWNKC